MSSTTSSESTTTNDNNNNNGIVIDEKILPWVGIGLGITAILGLGGWWFMENTNKENERRKQQAIIQQQQRQAMLDQQQKQHQQKLREDQDLTMRGTGIPNYGPPSITYSAIYDPFSQNTALATRATAVMQDEYDPSNNNNNNGFDSSPAIMNPLNQQRSEQKFIVSGGSLVDDANLNHNNFNQIPVITNPIYDTDEIPSGPAIPNVPSPNQITSNRGVGHHQQQRQPTSQRNYNSESDDLEDIL